MDLQGWSYDPKTYTACVNVVTRELPQISSVRRAASIILQINRFVNANSDAEDQALSAILSLFAECPTVERQSWKSRLLRDLESRSSNPVYVKDKLVFLVTKQKYNRFKDRMAKAGL